MFSLKSVDRVALVAMFSVIGAIPVAAHACKSAQAHNDEAFQSVHAGMPASDVLALIGPPLRKMRFENTRTTAWDYTWGYGATFSVILDDAEVVVGKLTVSNDGG